MQDNKNYGGCCLQESTNKLYRPYKYIEMWMLILFLSIFASCKLCLANVERDIKNMAWHYCTQRAEEVPSRNPFIGWTERDILAMTRNGIPSHYDFLQNTLQSPVSLKPSEVHTMLKACLVQRAALHFIRDSPFDSTEYYENDEANPEKRCMERELKENIKEPLDHVSPFIETFDFDIVLEDFTLRGIRCVQQVASSLAKDLLEKMALPKPPPGPSSTAWLMGTRQLTEVIDLQKYSERSRGLEWADAWSALKHWELEKGELQGWMITYPSAGTSTLPIITLYYIK